MVDFTLSNIGAINAAAVAQLAPWPNFRPRTDGTGESVHLANHGPQCQAVQDDYRLHSEPRDVFFALIRAAPGAVEFKPLATPIQLSAGCSFRSTKRASMLMSAVIDAVWTSDDHAAAPV